jgi:hypothetical protein
VERGLYLRPDERPFDRANHTSREIPTFPYAQCNSNTPT